jgi:hypothetical protein
VTTSFTRTRTQLAQRILGKVIKIGSQSMASADSDVVYEAIDLRIKELHKMGIFWRKVTPVPVEFSLTGGQVSASAGAGDILFPITITWNNAGTSYPVYIAGPREYAEIPDKETEGNPQLALWKGGTEFLFYPVPAEDGVAELLYQKIVDDTSAGAAVDVDVSMLRCLIDIIKYDVADDYGVDEQIQQRWRVEAERAQIDLRKLGTPRVDLTAVAVDDFEGMGPGSRRPGSYYVDNGYVE